MWRAEVVAPYDDICSSALWRGDSGRGYSSTAPYSRSICWVFPKRGAKASLFGGSFLSTFLAAQKSGAPGGRSPAAAAAKKERRDFSQRSQIPLQHQRGGNGVHVLAVVLHFAPVGVEDGVRLDAAAPLVPEHGLDPRRLPQQRGELAGD